jgi:hypothetical protein
MAQPAQPLETTGDDKSPFAYAMQNISGTTDFLRNKKALLSAVTKPEVYAAARDESIDAAVKSATIAAAKYYKELKDNLTIPEQTKQRMAADIYRTFFDRGMEQVELFYPSGPMNEALVNMDNRNTAAIAARGGPRSGIIPVGAALSGGAPRSRRKSKSSRRGGGAARNSRGRYSKA